MESLVISLLSWMERYIIFLFEDLWLYTIYFQVYKSCTTDNYYIPWCSTKGETNLCNFFSIYELNNLTFSWQRWLPHRLARVWPLRLQSQHHNHNPIPCTAQAAAVVCPVPAVFQRGQTKQKLFLKQVDGNNKHLLGLPWKYFTQLENQNKCFSSEKTPSSLPLRPLPLLHFL